MSGSIRLLGAVLLIAAFCVAVDAADKQDVTLTVTIRQLGVTVTPANYDFGILSLNETKISETALVVTNTGNDNEDMGVRIKDEDDQDEWTAANAAAEDVYVLSTRLAATAGAFVPGDILAFQPEPIWCDGIKFGGGGKDMAKDATVNQWFQLTTPTDETNPGDAHAITVEVSCRKAL